MSVGDARVSGTTRQELANTADKDIRTAWAKLAAEAERLFDQHLDEAAFQLVWALLYGLDPERTVADLGLADAAVIHVQDYENPDGSLDAGWAAYARDANQSLRGDLHPRTLRAGGVLAAVYRHQAVRQPAFYEQAGEQYQLLAAGHRQLSNVTAADLADVQRAACLHAVGRCGEPIRLAGRCWQSWSRTRPCQPDAGAQIAGPYLAMLRLCRRLGEAVAVEDEALALLPAGFGPGTLPFDLAVHDEPLHPRLHEPVCARHRLLGEKPVRL
jgi:hypothetical protein